MFLLAQRLGAVEQFFSYCASDWMFLEDQPGSGAVLIGLAIRVYTRPCGPGNGSSLAPLLGSLLPRTPAYRMYIKHAHSFTAINV